MNASRGSRSGSSIDLRRLAELVLALEAADDGEDAPRTVVVLLDEERDANVGRTGVAPCASFAALVELV